MAHFSLSLSTSLFLVVGLSAIDAKQARADAEPIKVAAADWPWWRGSNRNGVADPNQKPPLHWSETQNVLWKVPVPGRGHGSPIVVGDQVFLAAAEEKGAVQSILCFDRRTGKELWQTEVHRGGVVQGGNGKSTLASSTPACDGTRVFVNFLHDKGIYTTALDRTGKRLWQTKVADYILHQGFASSPAVYEGLVIVSADNKGESTGAIVALDRASGDVVWRVSRPKAPNYASPIILNVAGREQLFLIGCDLVTSLNPKTGEKIWEIPGSTTECVTSTVTDGQLMITSGGYPKGHVAAIRADGSGKVVWEHKSKVYVPSMLMKDGHLYAVADDGVATCWKADTGAKAWSGRLEGNFSASPVLVGDLIYATSEAGRMVVFRASPEKLDVIADNQLGKETLATPAICGGRIYVRSAVPTQGRRQEYLYCVAMSAPTGKATWQGGMVVLTRADVKLELRDGERIAPKSAGIAKDLMFQVLKDEDGQLQISSRRQQGWIAKKDAVQFAQALAVLNKLLAENPKDSHLYTARGAMFDSTKEPEKALADFNKAIDLDPKATLAYYHRANRAYVRGEYDTALADYNTVIKNDPEFDWAYHVRGWIFYRKKDYEKALADYETAIRLVPTETVFFRDRGNVAFIQKQYDKALVDYSKSIELDPNYPVPWLQRGKTWQATKVYDKALADYEKVMELTAKDSFASSYSTPLALLLASCPEAKLRDGKRALALAQKAYGLTKGPAEMAALAAAYAEVGEFDEAAQWQTKALAVAPALEKDDFGRRLKLFQDRKPYRLE